MDHLDNYLIFDSLMDSVIVIGLAGEVVYSNEAFSNLCEIPLRQILKKKNLNELFNITPTSILEPKSLEQLEAGIPYEEVSFTSTSGKSGKVQVSIQPILDDQNTKKFLVFIHDVTLEARLQDKYRSELSQKDRKLSEISLLLEISNALTGISDTDTVYSNVAQKLIAHGVCDFACYVPFQKDDKPDAEKAIKVQTWPETFEISPKALTPFKDLWASSELKNLAKEKYQSLFNLFAAKIKMDDQTQITFLPLQTARLKGGALLLFKANGSAKHDPDDLNLLKSVSAQTVVALESAQFFENSITDEMTQLFNKRYFLTRLQGEIDRARRNKEKLSFVIFDVDHFKLFNDKHGHQTGDSVLKEVAKAAKNVCRNYDVAARYGGEEFVLILPNTDAAGAAILAERLRKKIEDAELKSGETVLKITISLGVSIYPEQTVDSTELISLADKALYFAKRTGRNRVKIYDTDCDAILGVAKT